MDGAGSSLQKSVETSGITLPSPSSPPLAPPEEAALAPVGHIRPPGRNCRFSQQHSNLEKISKSAGGDMQRDLKERKARVRHRIREQKIASRARKYLEDAAAAAAAVATPGGCHKQMST